MGRLRSAKTKLKYNSHKNWAYLIVGYLMLKALVYFKHQRQYNLQEKYNFEVHNSIQLFEFLREKWSSLAGGLTEEIYEDYQPQVGDPENEVSELLAENPSAAAPTSSPEIQEIELPNTSCNRLLNSGNWKDFKFQPTEDGSLNLPSGDWCYSGRFQPDSCDVHNYSSDEIEECLLKNSDGSLNENSVQIIGDSRARLIYRVLSARLHGAESIEDVKVHDDMANAPFIYYWSQSFHGKPVAKDKHEMSGFRRLLIEGTTTKKSQLVIISEHFLHPATDILHFPKNRTRDHIYPYFQASLDFLRNDIVPVLLKMVNENQATVVILASEGSRRYYAGFNQDKWDELQKFYNSEIKKIVAENFGKIFYMSNNIKTSVGINGEILLPDGTHKIIKGAVQTIPPSLLTDTSLILNLHCNRKMVGKIENSACCRNWEEWILFQKLNPLIVKMLYL